MLSADAAQTDWVGVRNLFLDFYVHAATQSLHGGSFRIFPQPKSHMGRCSGADGNGRSVSSPVCSAHLPLSGGVLGSSQSPAQIQQQLKVTSEVGGSRRAEETHLIVLPYNLSVSRLTY